MSDYSNLNNTALRLWLDFTSGGESPASFRVWSFLSAVAACLGRRNTYDHNIAVYCPNMYVVIVGPAAVRKSTAGKLAVKLISKYTNVKLGPKDTSGKKQGLISAFVDAYEDIGEITQSEAVESQLEGMFDKPDLNAAFDSYREDAAKRERKITKKADPDTPRDLYIFADELANFIGQNQIELINFLTEVYYQEDSYKYKLAKATQEIIKPGLNILSCTTPISLASHLPPSSIGQGFTSRCIMIYENRPEKKVYKPPPYDPGKEKLLGEILLSCSEIKTNFTLSPVADKLAEHLYLNYTPNIDDTRFDAYKDRRNEHLFKLGMILSAMEGRTEINELDIQDAHMLLGKAEQRMPEALGQVGLDKLTTAKQNLLESIKNSELGISYEVLQANSLRDMQLRDFKKIIDEFVHNEICIVTEKTASNGKKVKVVLPLIKDDHAMQESVMDIVRLSTNLVEEEEELEILSAPTSNTVTSFKLAEGKKWDKI